MTYHGLLIVASYAKQKNAGCKKVWDQSETALQTGRCKQKSLILGS